MSAPYMPAAAISLSPKARALAMDPAAARRACAASLRVEGARLAEVIPFAQPPTGPRLSLREAALAYVGHPEPRPNGLAKQIALENDLNYTSLLTRIQELRRELRVL
jgi:hypothetical protein